MMAAAARTSGTISPESLILKRGWAASRHWRERAAALARASRARRERDALAEYRRGAGLTTRFLALVLLTLGARGGRRRGGSELDGRADEAKAQHHDTHTGNASEPLLHRLASSWRLISIVIIGMIAKNL